MSHEYRSTRREFLKSASLGAIAAGGLIGGLGTRLSAQEARAATTALSLIATDGYITMPGRDDPVYIFGFVKVPSNLTISQLVSTYKGHAQHTAPTLDFKQNDDIKITLTNLGLKQRPDLTDGHTIHWHGFDIPSPLNDGVPEVSVGVPISKQLTYFYRPHREGTYMYHCHFEDVEHVQMGMTGIVFVRPLQDGTDYEYPVSSGKHYTKFAYNDGDGSTGYNRHFAILENETWAAGYHDGDFQIQETVHTDYDPEWFTLNGRCYPQTVLGNYSDGPVLSGSPSGLFTTNLDYGTNDRSQPNSALIQVREGERALLRLANLGYRQNAMQLPGIPMHVVGQDASLLDTSYKTDTLYIGPGEARDVLFDAPPYSALRPHDTDGIGTYNVYYFKNRDWRKLSNNGAAGAGGMMTEVRVYSGTTLPDQIVVSQTYV